MMKKSSDTLMYLRKKKVMVQKDSLISFIIFLGSWEEQWKKKIPQVLTY